MRLRTFLLCGLMLTLSTFAAPTHKSIQSKSTVPQGPTIRVLLAKDVPSALLEVKGAYRVVRKDTGAEISLGSKGKRFVAHALQDGLRWGEEYLDVFQITVKPRHPETLVYVNGIQYNGAISLYHVKNNLVTVVNEVPVEQFVKSVMAVEYEHSLAVEAMRALAIKTRSDTYARVLAGKNLHRPWDVTAEESCYFGYGVTQGGNGVDAAVDWTRFMIVESIKEGGRVAALNITPEEAQELALSGLDAEKIIRHTQPLAKFGVTIDPDEVALR